MKIQPSRAKVGWCHVEHGVISAHYPAEVIRKALDLNSPWVSIGGVQLTRNELTKALAACKRRPT